jgi:hypothetical protein
VPVRLESCSVANSCRSLPAPSEDTARRTMRRAAAAAISWLPNLPLAAAASTVRVSGPCIASCAAAHPAEGSSCSAESSSVGLLVVASPSMALVVPVAFAATSALHTDGSIDTSCNDAPACCRVGSLSEAGGWAAGTSGSQPWPSGSLYVLSFAGGLSWWHVYSGVRGTNACADNPPSPVS